MSWFRKNAPVKEPQSLSLPEGYTYTFTVREVNDYDFYIEEYVFNVDITVWDGVKKANWNSCSWPMARKDQTDQLVFVEAKKLADAHFNQKVIEARFPYPVDEIIKGNPTTMTIDYWNLSYR